MPQDNSKHRKAVSMVLLFVGLALIITYALQKLFGIDSGSSASYDGDNIKFAFSGAVAVFVGVLFLLVKSYKMLYSILGVALIATLVVNTNLFQVHGDVAIEGTETQAFTIYKVEHVVPTSNNFEKQVIVSSKINNKQVFDTVMIEASDIEWTAIQPTAARPIHIVKADSALRFKLDTQMIFKNKTKREIKRTLHSREFIAK
jgi:hypothetical protein